MITLQWTSLHNALKGPETEAARRHSAIFNFISYFCVFPTTKCLGSIGKDLSHGNKTDSQLARSTDLPNTHPGSVWQLSHLTLLLLRDTSHKSHVHKKSFWGKGCLRHLNNQLVHEHIYISFWRKWGSTLLLWNVNQTANFTVLISVPLKKTSLKSYFFFFFFFAIHEIKYWFLCFWHYVMGWC